MPTLDVNNPRTGEDVALPVLAPQKRYAEQ